jgi:hypothetical protein
MIPPRKLFPLNQTLFMKASQLPLKDMPSKIGDSNIKTVG